MAGKHVGSAAYVSALTHPDPSPYRKENRAYADGAEGRAQPGDTVGNEAHTRGAANAGNETAQSYIAVGGNFGSGVASLTGLSTSAQTRFTISVWIKNDGTDWTGVGTRRIVSWGDGTTGSNACMELSVLTATGINGQSTPVGFTPTDNVNEANASRTGNEWVHVCFVRSPNPGNNVLYINGVSVDTDPTGAGNLSNAASDEFYIGTRHITKTFAESDAIIADLWIGWAEATADQALRLYNNGRPPNPGTNGQNGVYGELTGAGPIIFLGGPGYDWTATPLVNNGAFNNLTVSTGSVSAAAGPTG